MTEVPDGVTSAKIDELIEASKNVVATNIEVAASARMQAQAQFQVQERAKIAKRRYLLTLLIVVLGFSGLYTRQEVTNNNAAYTRNKIIDCLNPGGECYTQEQANTAALIAALTGANSKIVSLAAACAPSYVELPLPQRISAIQKCISGNLH